MNIHLLAGVVIDSQPPKAPVENMPIVVTVLLIGLGILLMAPFLKPTWMKVVNGIVGLAVFICSIAFVPQFSDEPVVNQGVTDAREEFGFTLEEMQRFYDIRQEIRVNDPILALFPEARPTEVVLVQTEWYNTRGGARQDYYKFVGFDKSDFHADEDGNALELMTLQSLEDRAEAEGRLPQE